MSENTNSPVKEFLEGNKYQFLAACLAFGLTIVGAYVALQLFEQSTTTRIQALETDNAQIKQTIYGKDGVQTGVVVLQNQVIQVSKDVQDIHRYFFGE